jgi:DNA polymerase III epsilon subunit-like protein
MPKILVFDTETTDRGPNYPYDIIRKAKENVSKQNNGKYVPKKKYAEALNAEYSKPEYLPYKPYIIQLSYIVYDLDEPENSKIFDKYIRIPPHVSVSPGAAAVNHIRYKNGNRDIFIVKTEERDGKEVEIGETKVKKEKIGNIREIMDEFVDDCESCDLLIGHNVKFDKERVLDELQRLEEEDKPTVFRVQQQEKQYVLDAIKILSLDDRYYCTMQKSKSVCKIKSRHPKAKETTYKIPKLLEAYEQFFGYIPQDLHNALVDIITCLRVYMFMEHQGRDVCNENREISKILRSKMSPEDRKRFPCGGPNRSDSIEEPSPEEKEDVIIPLIVETRPLSVERQQTSVWRCLGDQCKKFTSVFSRHRSRKVHPTGGKRKTYKKQKK